MATGGFTDLTAEKELEPFETRLKWGAKFLAALAEYPLIVRAARHAGISRQHAYAERNRDPRFAEAWKEALDVGVAKLEKALWKRGVEKSDVAAIFLLKAHKPEVYNENVRLLGLAADRAEQGGVDVISDIRAELLRDPRYLAYLRSRAEQEDAGGGDVESRFVCQGGGAGEVGDGAASQGAGQSANGDHPE